VLEQLTNSLVSINKEIAVVVLAALPIAELRGSIPLAIALGFPPVKAFLLSFGGNMLPVIPLLFFLQPLVDKVRHIGFFRKFFDWLFERTKRNAALIEKFEAVGLMLFVAVPLPGTGAWAGCVAATLFKIRFRYAFLAIAAGVLIAGCIILALSLVGKELLT